jgi:hypothetical protein
MIDREDDLIYDYQSLMTIAESCSTSLSMIPAHDPYERGSIMRPSARQLLDDRLLYKFELEENWNEEN